MTDEKKPFLSDEEIKTIVFAFCEYSNPMSSEKAFSHPPALTDRWKMWCETDKAKELINSAAEKANAKIAELQSQLRASERLRVEDTWKTKDDLEKANAKIAEQELIIHGIEEGSGEWQLKASDLSQEVEQLEKERDELQQQLNLVRRAIEDAFSGDYEQQR